jgi:diguanylate cyclase (GGDEF)-like protein
MTDDAAPPPVRLTPGRRRLVRVLRTLLLVAVAAYVLSTLPGVRSSSGYNLVLDGLLSTGILLGCSAIVLVRVALVRQDRLAWLTMAVGLAVYATGDVVYNGWTQFRHPIPYPSAADALWLAFYVFPYVALVLLVRRRMAVFHASMWLDGLVGVLGAASLGTLAVNTIARAGGATRAAVLTTLAYPVADVLLLLVVVGIYGLLGWRPDRSWALLGAGIATYAVADVVYLLQVSSNTYHAGTPLDAMWAVGYALTACAALVVRQPERDEPNRLEGWWVLLFPSLFTITALGLLVYGSLASLPLATVVLATACVACGLSRTALTFREVQHLADSRRQARTDELTGLGNRRSLYESLQAFLDRLGPDRKTAVMIIDLDRFKDVNDSLGHHVGDQLLQEVATRLAAVTRRDDELVRLGGDEFAVALRETSHAEAVAVAARMIAELQRAFVLNDVVVHTAASIGIAMAPDVGTTVSGLLQRADIAMYEAKADRSGCVVYEAADDDDLRLRLRTVNELRDAIGSDQLVLHYQPQGDMRTDRIVGVEALVRWQHPERGLVFPDAFIPHAERAGFMRLLTARVLGMAADQAASWRSAGLAVPIAVNISASNLLDVELPDQVFDLLASRGLPRDALVMEITESTLMLDRTRSLAVLNRLHEGGIRISVDDYGTGYSSLAYLRDLPIDELKLDRSFTMELRTDPRADAIVESTVHLAHSLGLRLVAEGIESAATWDQLAAYGCDVGQGYFLSRPAPADQLTALLARAPGVPAPRTVPATRGSRGASANATGGAASTGSSTRSGGSARG